MIKNLLMTILAISLLPLSNPAVNADSGETMKVDSNHVDSWNDFTDMVLDLHKQQIQGREIITTEVDGGYLSNPEFYREVTYTDKKTGRILSIIQWESEHPDRVHSIEVFVRNNAGKVIRDFSASYLPGSRNAPVQTLINLHHYNDGLHAFRQFDVTKDVIYEYCKGEYNGKKHELRLFEDDLVAADYDSRQLLKSPVYKACFHGLQASVGKYINPQ